MDRPHYPEGEKNHCISCDQPFPCVLWHEKHKVEVEWWKKPVPEFNHG